VPSLKLKLIQKRIFVLGMIMKMFKDAIYAVQLIILSLITLIMKTIYFAKVIIMQFIAVKAV
jgi:hypothetical protein